MVLALRPATIKLLLLAAGVLLGLLAVALLVSSHTSGAHSTFFDASTTVHFVAKLRPLGVLWH
jgi:hypothetical protein